MFIAGILLSGVQSFAQKPGQPQTNSPLSLSLAKEYGALREQALKMAKEKGWPVRKEKADGSIAELVEVSPEGTPLYYTTSNAGSAITSRANKLYPSGGLGLSLTGLNTKAGIWDGGGVRTSHTTFGGRATSQDGSPTAADHPTHVGGTMIGSGGFSNPQARGIAYEGTLYTYEWTNDYEEMAAIAGEIVVSNHSYGLDSSDPIPANRPEVYNYGKYSTRSRSADAVAFDNPKYQIVAAAGNDRGDGINPTKNGNDLLSWMGVSKNVLVVAAVQQVDNYTRPSDVRVASFTSYGPTDDFRIKPDIATKGVSVFSSVASGITAYDYMNGTSMASPGVSGVVMLLQQHWNNLHPSDDEMFPNYMRSATVRALVAHTADEIGANAGPDHMTGWGLINAEKCAQLISNETAVTQILQERTLQSSGVYTVNVNSNGVDPLVATIAWTDPAGATANSVTDSSTAVLVNNLDLKLTSSSGEVFYPWRLVNSWTNPVAEKGLNNVDNIEKVEIAAPAGTYTLQVSHRGTLRGGSQDYSLVVTGIDGTNAVKEFNDDSLAVWPNPASDVLNIDFNNGSFDNAELSIYDVQGRNVSKKSISGSHNAVNISNLSSGIYFVKINESGSQYVKKIFVK